MLNFYINVFLFIILESIIFIIARKDIRDIGMAFVANFLAAIFLAVNYTIQSSILFDLGFITISLVFYAVKILYIRKYDKKQGYISLILTLGLLFMYLTLLVEKRY